MPLIRSRNACVLLLQMLAACASSQKKEDDNDDTPSALIDMSALVNSLLSLVNSRANKYKYNYMHALLFRLSLV